MFRLSELEEFRGPENHYCIINKESPKSREEFPEFESYGSPVVSGSSAGKESTCKNPPGSIPGSRSSLAEGLGYPLHYSWASLVAQMVKKSLPAVWETWVQSLGWEDPLEEGMATHSSILAWKIPWTEELAGYSPWGRKESDTIERLKRSTQHWSPSCHHTTLTK